MHSQTWHGKAEWDDDHWGLNVEAGSSKADGGSKHQVFLEFLNWSDYTVDIGGAPKAPGTISYPGAVLGNAAAFATDPGWSGNLVDKPTRDKEIGRASCRATEGQDGANRGVAVTLQKKQDT